MSIPKHIHQYVRIKIGPRKRLMMKCAIAKCTHSIVPELAIGRASVCNRCFNEFVLTSRSITLARPHCDDCTKTKSIDETEIIQKRIEDLLL